MICGLFWSLHRISSGLIFLAMILTVSFVSFPGIRKYGTSVSGPRGMVIGVVKYSSGGYKIRKLLPKNQHTQRKFLNFDNWCSGEVSKIEHHFSK